MFCKSCGKEIKENTKFCPFCGEKIVEDNQINESISEENNDFNSVHSNNIVDEPIVNNNFENASNTSNLNNVNNESIKMNQDFKTNNFNSVNSNNIVDEPIVNNNFQSASNTSNLNSVNNESIKMNQDFQTNDFNSVNSNNIVDEPIVNNNFQSASNASNLNSVNNESIKMNQNLNNMKANNNGSKKNILFLIVVIVLVLIIIGLGLFIGYKLVGGTKENVVQNEKTNIEETETVKKVEQAITFNLDGYTFKLPSGYKYSLTDGVHLVMDDKREVVLEFDNVFKLSFAECAASTEEIKATLIKQGFDVASYEQKKVNDIDFLVFKIIEENKEIYMYVAKLDENNIVKGYFVMSSYSTVDSALEKIGVIISSATGTNSNESTTFSKSLPKISENNLFESKLKK